MQAQVRTHLQALVKDLGPRIADDPKRLTGLLLDHCLGRYRAEIDAIALAASAGVPVRLASVRDPADVEKALEDGVAAVQRALRQDPRMAKWSVDAWALALGKVDKQDLSFRFHCLACKHSEALDRSMRAAPPLNCPRCGRAQAHVGSATPLAQQSAGANPSGSGSGAVPPSAPRKPPRPPPPPPPPPRPPPPPPPPPQQQRQQMRPQVGKDPNRKVAAIGAVVLVGLFIVVNLSGQKTLEPQPKLSQLPPPAQPLPTVPPPVAAVLPQWTIAAVRARAYSSKAFGKPVVELRRGQVVDVVERTDTLAHVRTGSGSDLWIDPIVAVTKAEAVRVSARTCAQYAEETRATFNTRWEAILNRVNEGPTPFVQFLIRVKQRDAGLVAWLAQTNLVAMQPAESDPAANVWHRWSARYADSMARVREASNRSELLRDALVCSEAAAHADWLDAENYARWAIAANKLGQEVPIPSIAVPYLAPTDSNAWAVLMFAIAAHPKASADVELLSGSVVQLLKVSRSRAASLEFLEETKARSPASLVAAINQAIQETEGLPPRTSRAHSPPSTMHLAKAGAPQATLSDPRGIAGNGSAAPPLLQPGPQGRARSDGPEPAARSFATRT